MEQNIKPGNRHRSICSILEKVALQICGEMVDYLINSVEKNENESERRKGKEDLAHFMTPNNKINSNVLNFEL